MTMTDPQTTEPTPMELSREEMMSALFAQMVMQQSSLAMMLLGKTPHPETGQTIKDLEGAKLMIDQLEMLEEKTKGNLTQDEAGLLKQSLMALRMAFVEAVDGAESPAAMPPTQPNVGSGGHEAASGSKETPPSTDAHAGATTEHRPKFTKKY
jgi:hypothetical protein